MRTLRLAALIAWTTLLVSAPALAQGTKADYDRADALREKTRNKVFKLAVQPHWFAEGSKFWYRNDLADGVREFIVVDAPKGQRRAAFDHKKLAEALSEATGKSYTADHLPFDSVDIDEDGAVRFELNGKTWRYDPDASKVAESEARKRTSQESERSGQDRGGRRRSGTARTEQSPDGKWTAFIRDHDVYLREKSSGTEHQLSYEGTEHDGYEARVAWSPDSSKLVALRTAQGDSRKVYLIESSPKDQLQPKLQSYDYLKPGDQVPISRPHLFDVASRKEIPISTALCPNPYSIEEVRWVPDSSRFTFVYNQRGHQVLRIIRVDAATGEAKTLIDEQSPTFIDYAHKTFVRYLDETNEIVWMSERDGWNHLYLFDARTGELKNQITKGSFVVRAVDRVDDDKRQIWFHAGGLYPEQDPYYIHYARVNFDGSNLVLLTEGDGTHTITYSPDRKYLIDTYSRVDQPPVSELRSAQDGKLICELERAECSELLSTGCQVPERFVAKGRDSKTDIYGVIYRPTRLDPDRKYPVIEAIYAGPQGAFVPKAFLPYHRTQALTELGFIVVQIDGMGTNWRSRAFHDVACKNLGDAGFPDRILWMKAAARKYPYMDLSRVGLYGGSAGGQNALGGLLFHPEFYKVAVADCGCHDNRMDKIWWNEAWMGWPVGPEYAASSNVANAHKLQGKLLLMVGELDRNVDPASTMQVVNALIKANKDFDLVVFPGAGHGAGGGPYGEHRRRDFFVRHLLGVEPPDRNATAPRDSAVTRTAALYPAEPKHEASTPARSQDVLDLEDLTLDRSEMRGVIERYSTDHGSLLRSLPAGASPLRDRRLKEFCARWLEGMASLDFDAFSLDGQVDYLMLKNYLEHEIRQIDQRTQDAAEAASLVPFSQTILDLDEGRRQLKTMDWSKTGGALMRLAKEITDARQKISDARPKVNQRIANRAVGNVEGLRSMLREWNSFYNGYDPMFTWWMAEPYKAADQALQSYAGFLRQRFGAVAADSGPGGFRRRGGLGGGGRGEGSEQGSATSEAQEEGKDIVGNPIGREALLDDLKYEMVPYTPDELIELAQKEFAWCEAEMKKASREMGYGDDWHAALEHVKTLYVEPGKQPDLIRDLAVEAIEYLDANNLVTVPQLCRDTWRIAMMSPERQLVNPFFTGGEVISVSYPTNTMSHEAKLMSMRGNNIHFARATVFHELIPGHHLQGYMTARYKPYRGLFSTPFWGEGWALYWELLVWDRNFARSPENRVGMLFWRMHRCARIIFSLSFHLEKMSPKECIDFLVDRVGHERENAIAEVRRSFNGSYGPLYQAAYLLGGLQLHSLHRELVDSGKMTDRAFHDAVLKENRIPIEMVRVLLTKPKLTRTYTTSWRFYDLGPAQK